MLVRIVGVAHWATRRYQRNVVFAGRRGRRPLRKCAFPYHFVHKLVTHSKIVIMSILNIDFNMNLCYNKCVRQLSFYNYEIIVFSNFKRQISKEMENNSLKNTQTIVDTLPMPVSITDVETMTVLYANEAYIKLFEFSSIDNIVGKSIYDVLSIHQNNETDKTALYERLIKDFDITFNEIQVVSGTGKKINMCLHTCHIEYSGKKAAFSVMTEQQESDLSVIFNDVHVLLCEDYFLNQEIAVDMFSRLGIVTAIAENGKQCLEILNIRKTFDLIFMDLRMPVMDGYETARAIRSNPEFDRIPVISLTAEEKQEVKEECFKAGMNDILTKPIVFDNLIRIFNTWLPESKFAAADKAPSKSEVQPILQPIVAEANNAIDDISNEPPKEALARFGGKRALYEKALFSFANELLPNEWADFGKAIQNKEETAREIHKLKGVAGNLSENGIYKCIVEFEGSLRSGKPSKNLYEKLVTVCNIAKIRILHNFKLAESEPKEIGTAEEFYILINHLRDALYNYDPADSSDIIEIMKKKKWTSVKTVKIKNLYELTDKYEFDDALTVLNSINFDF